MAESLNKVHANTNAKESRKKPCESDAKEECS